MSLKDKVAIVTGGNSGIGQAIVLELARQGASIVIDYVAHPEATSALEQQIAKLGSQSIGVDSRCEQACRPAEAHRRRREPVRPRGHHGEQCRHRNTNLGSRHDRSAVRGGHERKPQERLLCYADRSQADDQAGWRRPHHQHHLGARGLADARQHGILPRQRRHAHAHAHCRPRARKAQYPRGRGRPGRGGRHRSI